MRAKAASFFQYPRWVAALVIAMAVTTWSLSLHSTAGQVGRPLPNFFHTPGFLLKFIPNGLPNPSGAKGGREPWQSKQA
jgi:hypothetical protein